MLRDISDFDGCAIGATDGTIGHVRDFFFDDQAWIVRWLVVDTGSWLSSRKVLLSPLSIGRPDWRDQVLQVPLTRQQVKDSPDIDTDQPVSRQHELRIAAHYGYELYSGGTGYWAAGMYPALPGKHGRAASAAGPSRGDDPHLRSLRTITGYHMHALDGDIGHVQGLLLDDEGWAIRYLIVNTGNWWLGHQVLVAPQWIAGVSWDDAKVFAKLTRQAIKTAPPYQAGPPLDRVQESRLHEHYGQRGYWTDQALRDGNLPRF